MAAAAQGHDGVTSHCHDVSISSSIIINSAAAAQP